MPPIEEGQLRFDFPKGWRASKFDDWSFYRNQFGKLASAQIQCSKCGHSVRCAECGETRVAGTKGIDILAIAPNSTCWQIEIKDYRNTLRSSFVFLADEVALKVRDTLACLVAAAANANDATERSNSNLARDCKRIRIVLHLEQPVPRSRLESKSSRRANVQQRLKQLAKSIDPHPLVLDMANMNGIAWTVTQKPRPRNHRAKK